jgi:hypothetical protein
LTLLKGGDLPGTSIQRELRLSKYEVEITSDAQSWYDGIFPPGIYIPLTFELQQFIKSPCDLSQGQLQEWTEHSHTDLPKSETSRDIKKSF